MALLAGALVAYDQAMRWRELVLSGVFVLASCSGSGGTANDATGTLGSLAGGEPERAGVAATVGAAERIADDITATFGDDTAAFAAVLLAADHGYGLDQILAAASADRLQADGGVTGPEGGIVEADYEPSGSIIDDVSEGASQPSGIRSPPNTRLLSQVISDAGDEFGHGALAALIMMLWAGYSPDQIVATLVLDAHVSNDYSLVDDNGVEIEPDRSPFWEDTYSDLDDWYWTTLDDQSVVPLDSAPGRDGSVVAGTAADAEQERLAKLVEQAAGVYSISPDLVGHLEGLGDVVSVAKPDGEFVVEPDGTVRGSMLYSIAQGVDGEVTLTTVWDRAFAEAELAQLDDGLTFTSQATLFVTWNGGDSQEYVETVTGLIDVKIGQLVITGLTELDSVRFER